MSFFLLLFDIFDEPERCEGLFMMSRTSEPGQEVLSEIRV